MAARNGIVFCRLLTNSVCNAVTVTSRGYKRCVAPTLIALKARQKRYIKSTDEETLLELKRRSNFIEWNYSAEVFAFGKRLQEDFPSELLIQAFTHRSYIVKEELKQKELGIESPYIGLKDNSELVTKGEKVIANYIPCYLSYFFPRFPLEGIQCIQKYLSSEELLANVSKNLGTTFLILSADYPVESETYAKTLKAIIGALTECQGLNRSQLFVRDFIVTQLAGKNINNFLEIENPLEILTEILKRDGKEAPEPRIICQSAMNTILANYHVGMYCNKQLIGHCSGESIDTAVRMAALDALMRLFDTTESSRPISYDLEQIPSTVANLSLNDWHSSAFDKQVSLKV